MLTSATVAASSLSRAGRYGFQNKTAETAGGKQENPQKLCNRKAEGQMKTRSMKVPVHPRVTEVARNRSWSSCQRCTWQITAKHSCILRMWLCRVWRHMVHGCMVYTGRAETAAVSRVTSHVTTKQRCTEYTTWVHTQTAL